MNMKRLPLFFTLVLALFGAVLSAQGVELMAFDRPTTHTIALAGQDEVEIRLKGLLPGEEFALYLQQDPTYPAVVYTHLPESVTNSGTVELSGKSDGKPVVFCLDVLAKNLKAIDLKVLKNPKIFASTLNKVVGDTIETEANDDVEFLLNNVFRKDTCFALFPGEIRSNPRNIPRPGSQTGIFRNGGPTVGIDSGIIISTGFIEAAPGPNDFAIAQQGVIDFLPMNDDFPDAERLVPPGEFIHDVVILEFDFIPTTDTISFDYVFFSEQYCQSGNGVTNDAFGFLLSGPLGNDVNIARLPISGDIVSPATLNPSTVDAASFLHNTDPTFDNPCFPFPPPPERFAGIAYDGFSVPLTAVGRVVPCARHTLKIVLLDAGDFLSDSGILLEAGSFLAGLVNKPEPNTTAEVGTLTPVEGCDEATITFTRRTLTQEALDDPLFVKYNIIPYFGTGGIDPATRGITGANSDTADYILPVSPFVIPPGDTSGTLTIPILLDGVDENIEAFIIRYDGTCDCTENADTFYIRDNRDFDIDLGPDLSACAGTEIILNADPGGGNGDFTYNWPDPTIGDTNRVTYIATGRDTTINLTMMDGCGLTGTGSVTISAPNITADVGGFYSLCSNPVAMVNLQVGGSPSSFYDIVVRVDSNGVITDIPFRILGDTIFEFTRSADFSILSITDDTGCGGSGGNDVARIRSSMISDTSRIVQPNCNQPIGSIDVLTRDGNENYTFRWLDGSGSTATTRNALAPGTYEVEVTPNFDMSCLDTLRFALAGPPVLEIDTIRTFLTGGGVEEIPTCPGQTFDLVAFVSGGTLPYTFSWPDSMGTDSILTVVTQTGRTVYPFEVTDDCGETVRDSLVIDLPDFSIELGGRYSLCNVGTVAVPLITSGPAGSYTVEIRIDSAGFSTTRFLIRSPGSSDLLFDYPATITAISITNSDLCQGDTINGVATVVDPQIRFNAAVENIRCNGESTGSITLTDASNVPVVYDWSDIGIGTATRTGLAAATYGLRISDVDDPSCFRDTSFVLTEPVPLAVALSQGTASCPMENDTLIPVITGGTPPYVFNWPDSMRSDTFLAIVTQPGSTTYTVEVTDNCGVMNSAFITYDLPDVSAAVNGTFGVCNTPFNVDVPFTLSGSSNYTVVIRENGVERTLNETGNFSINYTEATTIKLVSIAGADGCAGTITQDSATVVDLDFNVSGGESNVTCRGGSDGSLNLEVNGDSGAYTYAWATAGLAGANPTGLIAGTYNVVISDTTSVGCLLDTFFVITEPAEMMLNVSNTPVTCPGEMSTLSPTVSGGTPPYVFDWDNGAVADSLYAVTALAGTTTYPVVVTDACDLSLRDTVRITTPDVQASVGGIYGVCNAPFNVDVPFTLSGSSNYTVVIRENGVERTLNETGSFTINYSVATLIELLSVTGTDNCPVALTDTARVIDANFMVLGNETNASCRGGADGSLDLLVNGDSGAYTYAWGTAGLTGSNPTGLIAGTYFVTITDTLPSACFFEGSFIIGEPAMLVVDAQNDPVLCPGDLVDLYPIATGGTFPYTYDWENGNSIDSLYQVTTTGGTTRYPLVVTDACGLSVRDTVTIVLNDLRAEVSGTYSVCNPPNLADVPVTFTGNGPFTFVVSENGVERTLVATQDTVLRYTEATEIQLISVADGNNCNGIAGGIANVTDATFSVVPQIENVLCTNAATGTISVMVNGNNAAYDFSWDQPGLSGPAVSGLRAGTYGLTVTDRTPFGCTWDTTFFVLEPASAIVLNRDSVRDETCNELAFAAATYSGGTGQLTYNWSNGTSGGVLGEVSAGIYTLSVTDENLCEVTQVFNLQDRRSTVQAGIQTNGTTLSCDIDELTLSATQQTQVVTYAWSDQDDNDLGTTRGIMITEPGRYFVTLTNPANGCSATDSIDIGRDGDLLDLVIPAEYAITCIDNSVNISVSHPDFTGSVTYEWRFNGALVGNGAVLPNVADLGTYEVTVIRGDNGCPTVITTEVVMDRNVPSILLDAPAVTSNCRDPEVSIGVGSGGPYVYAWSTANGNITGPLNENRTTADRPGLYTVILTDTLNGCTSMASVTVINDGVTLTPNAGPDQVLICTGAGTVLNGSFSPTLNGTEVLWYAPDGSVIGEGLQVSTLDPGPHVFEVIHPESGCSSFDTVMVNSEAPGSVSYSLQQPPCPDVGGRLFVTNVTGLHGPYTYSSPTGIPEPFGTGLRGLRVGTNVLIVTDQLGCELRDTFQIFPGNTLDGEAEDVVIRLGEEAELGVTTNRTDGQLVSWEWRNLNDSLACLNCPDPRVSPLESFIAEVTVVDSNGCEVTLRQNVIVEEEDLIYMPSAFSPNGDGVNDIYTVFGSAEFVDGVNFLRIFDRWGNLVFNNENFQVNDPDSGWKGIGPDGQVSQSSVYVYSVSYNRWDGEAVIQRGDLTLVK